MLGLLLRYIVPALTIVAVLVVALVLFWAAVEVALAVLTAGVGIVGLLFVKLKRPIVSPNGHLFVPLVYAFLWAVAITVALYLGSLYVNRFVPRPVDHTFAWLGRDAGLFFIEAFAVLCLSVWASKRARADSWLTSALLLFAASIVFGALPALSALAGLTSGEILGALGLPLDLARDWRDPVGKVSAWLQATNGNLFKLTSVLPGLYLVLAVVALVLSFLLPKSGSDVRPMLNAAERRLFLWSLVVGALLLAVLGWIGWSLYLEPRHSLTWAQLAGVVLAYAWLLYLLLRSRWAAAAGTGPAPLSPARS
jgi:hypothetical protein